MSDSTIVTSEQHLYQTIVQFDKTIVLLPRKLATGNIHDYLFCYFPLVGILFEVLRILEYNIINLNCYPLPPSTFPNDAPGKNTAVKRCIEKFVEITLHACRRIDFNHYITYLLMIVHCTCFITFHIFRNATMGISCP